MSAVDAEEEKVDPETRAELYRRAASKLEEAADELDPDVGEGLPAVGEADDAVLEAISLLDDARGDGR